MDLVFDEKRTLLVRGVLDEWEEDGSTRTTPEQTAARIREALRSVLNENWSIIVDGAFDAGDTSITRTNCGFTAFPQATRHTTNKKSKNFWPGSSDGR
jgi:hypothetical protein